MKKFFLLSLLGLLLTQKEAYSCLRKKKKRAKKAATTRTVKKVDSTSTLVVSFISFGGGIDFRAVPDFEQTLKGFNQQQDCNMLYVIKNWGREGERDYCVTAKSSQCLSDFHAEVKKKFGTNEKIIIKENATCRE